MEETGGNVRTRSASAVAQPVLIAPQPSSQPPSPVSNPVRNPVLRNSSYSTHFQFHSRLNQPIITAKITIFFSEEEFVERPPARYERERPQVAIGGATCPGSEHPLAKDGKKEERGATQVTEGTPSVRQTPESNPHVVNVSMEFAPSSSGINPLLDPPGGSCLGDMERDGVNWFDYACPITVEQMDQ